MPIKDMSAYPPDWKEISRRIRHERAGNKCEQCEAPNHQLIIRNESDPAKFVILDDGGEGYTLDGTHERELSDAENYGGEPIRVVLTVAHMDHNPSNNDEANLRALCQRCHLVHDGPQPAENARKTRIAKKETERREAGQEKLL